MKTESRIVTVSTPERGRRILRLQSREGDELCRLTIDRFQVWSDGELYEVDGIGNVFTPDQYRNCGHAAFLMNAAVANMRSEHASASVLYGIDNFYHRFGYESCGNEQWTTIATDAIPDVPDVGVRPAKKADDQVCVNIYEKIGALTSGATCRSRPFIIDRVVLDGEGSIVGFATCSNQHPVRNDAAKQHPEAFVPSELHCLTTSSAAAATLYAARQWAQESGSTSIRIAAPQYHPISRYAVELGGTFTQEDRPNGGMMALPLVAHVARPTDWYQYLPDRF